jgi:hypothetical protein
MVRILAAKTAAWAVAAKLGKIFLPALSCEHNFEETLGKGLVP